MRSTARALCVCRTRFLSRSSGCSAIFLLKCRLLRVDGFLRRRRRRSLPCRGGCVRGRSRCRRLWLVRWNRRNRLTHRTTVGGRRGWCYGRCPRLRCRLGCSCRFDWLGLCGRNPRWLSRRLLGCFGFHPQNTVRIGRNVPHPFYNIYAARRYALLDFFDECVDHRLCVVRSQSVC